MGIIWKCKHANKLQHRIIYKKYLDIFEDTAYYTTLKVWITEVNESTCLKKILTKICLVYIARAQINLKAELEKVISNNQVHFLFDVERKESVLFKV